MRFRGNALSDLLFESSLPGPLPDLLTPAPARLVASNSRPGNGCVLHTSGMPACTPSMYALPHGPCVRRPVCLYSPGSALLIPKIQTVPEHLLPGNISCTPGRSWSGTLTFKNHIKLLIAYDTISSEYDSKINGIIDLDRARDANNKCEHGRASYYVVIIKHEATSGKPYTIIKIY